VPLGIASALKLAQGFTADENFAVILGDNFFEDTFEEEIKEFDKSGDKAAVFIAEVEDIKRFGCASLEGDKVTKIVEKPTEPESNWAVAGLYLYTPHAYQVADQLKLSHRKELEITDINTHYCPNQVTGFKLKGYWSDMGTPESMRRTEQFINETNFSIKT